ncbi:MAG TPA: dienelactone hydrolase family protein [Labilithrix sp.]|nr:dienelactone hydrolase family protein [Labilithrix sp.]
MTTKVSFEGKGGTTINGELAEPAGSGRAPSLVLIQEYWGINDHIRSLADRLAKEGFLVIAPDLYHGTLAKDAAEAGALMTALDTHAAVKEIGATADFLKAHARGNGKVGVIGFCMGGALALASACHLEGLSAIVPFYGIPPADKVDYAKVSAPILMHVATNDAWVTVERAEAIKKQIDAHGKSMTLETYDAGHAFVNDTRPDAYDEKSAKLAWQRSIDFLKKNLA